MNSKYAVENLGNYIRQVRGISYRNDDIQETPSTGYKIVLRANSIQENKLILQDLIYVKEKCIKAEQFIKNGDILIAASSGSKEIVGKSVQINEDTDLTFGAFCKLIRCKENINSKYVGYFLRTKYYRTTISNIVCGANINNLKNEHIDNLLIPIPRMELQDKIVKLLDKAQELIDKRKAQIEALDELVKSVFYEMFSSSILDSKHYKELKKCVDFIDYRGKTPEKSECGIKLITAKNVGFGCYKEEPREYISEELYESLMSRGFPKANDVLFATEGATLGYVARIPRNYNKFAVGQRLITMACKKSIKSEYLEKYMITQYFQNEVQKKSTGSSAKGIRSSELKEIKIPVPSENLQSKFVQLVETIEKQKEKLQQSLTHLEDNFNSLMQRAFNGKLFN